MGGWVVVSFLHFIQVLDNLVQEDVDQHSPSSPSIASSPMSISSANNTSSTSRGPAWRFQREHQERYQAFTSVTLSWHGFIVETQTPVPTKPIVSFADTRVFRVNKHAWVLPSYTKKRFISVYVVFP